MPRPKSIPWQKRVAIFLAYRRLGKVQPTAKRHDIARSTVVAIVKDFEGMGFSSRPRGELSEALLQEAQRLHVEEVLTKLEGALAAEGAVLEKRGQVAPVRLTVTGPNLDFSLGSPELDGTGGLSGEAALAPDAEDQLNSYAPLHLAEGLEWHLRDTEAITVIADARNAIRGYNRRCLQLWRTIASEVSAWCQMAIIPDRPDQLAAAIQTPHLAINLVSTLYRLAFQALDHTVTVEDLGWEDTLVAEGNVSVPVITFLGQWAVVGLSSSDPQARALERYISKWATLNLLEPQPEAALLRRLYGDMAYVETIVRRKLAAVTAADVGHGICPACPYPEAREESNTEGVEVTPRPRPRRRRL